MSMQGQNVESYDFFPAMSVLWPWNATILEHRGGQGSHDAPAGCLMCRCLMLWKALELPCTWPAIFATRICLEQLRQ